VSAYNYAAAFLLFSQGSSLEDISIQLNIPLKTLEGEAAQHGWKRLCHQLKLAGPKLPIEQSIAVVQRNREKSLKETEPLEDQLDYIVRTNLELRIELVYWAEEVDKRAAALETAEQITVDNPSDIAKDNERAARRKHEDALNARNTLRSTLSDPKRYKELAQGLAQVQELRYRAVGDVPNVNPGAKPDAHKSLTQVIVNMPDIVSKPRQVVDVTPVVGPSE
jgi:hypothetical protein